MNRLFTFRGKKQKARKKIKIHEVNASGFSFCSLKKETSRGASLDLSNSLACNAMASSVWACDGLRWGWIRPAAAGLQRKESESEVNRWIKHCGFVQSWPQLTPCCLHTRTVWTGEGSGTHSHKSTKTSSMKQICSCSPFSTQSIDWLAKFLCLDPFIDVVCSNTSVQTGAHEKRHFTGLSGTHDCLKPEKSVRVKLGHVLQQF